MSIDRRALKVLLAALGLEQRDLAARMGYDATYVSNIVNGFSKPSEAFKACFGEVVAEALFGCGSKREATYPAAPLKALVARRAAQAPSKAQFYADLGVASNGLNGRREFPAELVDRVCCALGVHPSALYPEFVLAEDAS